VAGHLAPGAVHLVAHVGVAVETVVAVTVLVAVLTAVSYGILVKTTPDT